MFRLTEASVSHSNLSMMVTYGHTNSVLSSTCLQLMGRSGEPGELTRSNPVAPGPRHPRTGGLELHSLGWRSRAYQDWRHTPPGCGVDPDIIAQSGACSIHLNADGT
jgi:hypothetical protein